MKTVPWILIALLGMPVAWASDMVDVKRMKMELALELAKKSVLACRKMGYQVSAVVVDRNGDPQAVLRDVYASRHTMDIARDKANAVILSGLDSGTFRDNREDIRADLNHVKDILILRGGLPIEAAGSLVGALGVSGAPGGDKDEACAKKALDSVEERLQFAD